MITFEETIIVDAEGRAILTLPPSVKPGPHRAVLQVDEGPTATRPAPKAGCLKGIWMSPDFNDPLEDFREYME